MNQVQHVTVTTLAPLEDILVQEITEHEHGACELVEHECSVIPVSIISWHGEPMLACRRVTEDVFTWPPAQYPLPCETCGHTPWRDCWSVVMLP